MRRLLLALTTSTACGSPSAEMLETDGSSSGSGSSDATGDSSASLSSTTSMTTSPGTTGPMPTTSATTTSADESSTGDPDTTAGSTGDCPPGALGCPCDIGSTCDGELLCVDGTCVEMPACDEPEGEPNDDEASAVALAEVQCGAAAMMVAGGFDGAESDWFSYHADAGIACVLDEPDVSVTSEIDVGVCLYVDCDNGQTNVNCSGGSQDDVSPDGLDGCCDQNAVSLGGFDCGLSAANATIVVRLTSIDAACVPYELSFDY